MELDSKSLSRLHRVQDPREVWGSESGDFTPWLAENIDVLGSALDMTLTVEGTEVFVGGFRLDIRATDGNGDVVIIENQLEATDHSHLGQCLIYAAGLEASTVIWVSRSFRAEFRRAFDWLNERTDNAVQFFGVEVGVVQIGDEGPRAPVFDVVARPNGWQKGLKAAVGKATSAPSSLNEARQSLFADVLSLVCASRPSMHMPAKNNGSWINFASGPFGTWGLAQIQSGELRVEAYLDCQDSERNARLLAELDGHREHWDKAVGDGIELDYQALEGKQACRVATHYAAVNVEKLSAIQRSTVVTWMAEAAIHMMDALDAHLRQRSKELKLLPAETAAYPNDESVPD